MEYALDDSKSHFPTVAPTATGAPPSKTMIAIKDQHDRARAPGLLQDTK